ncbi:cyclin-d3-2 [Phtheirospermum japonicum]|uniref:Cyclin-d3-2 n=1 Tax=Phtheirospermum japonicum TaxID=374723 RepID=A0A830BCS5_9LAMI|nr:cyclin-d3-2 [Phtheirospermum japonicum]
MASSQQHSPQILFDDLNCLEEHCCNGDSLLHTNCLIEGQAEMHKHTFVEILEQDLWEDNEELNSLLAKEQENEPYGGFEENPSLAMARGEAVEWMLKVVDYFSFSTLTAVLAVNYLDRFLVSFKSNGDKKPWMTQLAAVACLSLAAKVEETQVPLLLDFQVEESKYVFESKAIQKMEILILSTLLWKMNPVTPFLFLEYIAKRLKFKNNFRKEFFRRCECLVLSLISDCRFMCYLPSALATAVMVFVISCLEPCICVEYQDQLMGILGFNKEKVEDCCRLTEEVATSVNFYSNNKRKFRPMPGSPKGVVDISFSSDSSNDSWGLSPISSVSSSPQSLSKKIKSQEETKECNFVI